MIDVGILGLDTSHPEPFADLLADHPDATLAAVWDGGDVRSAEHATAFCEAHGATLYQDATALVEAVDAAMVLTVNWETHLPLARPFLEAGTPTFVDKPVAGNLADVEDLATLAGSDAPLFGGSALPFHPDIDDLPRGGADRSLYAAGYNDYFYYRVHLTDTARRLADADWASVAPLEEPGSTVRVRFENGTHATLRFDGATDPGAFGILDVADRTRTVELPATEEALAAMYDPFVDAFVETAVGDRDDTDRVLDAARLTLAVEAALARGHPVTPDSDAVAAVARDGETFLADYEPYY